MDYLKRVTHCIAVTTRYPIDVLTPNADLERDLGIDSVKRLEITLAIGEEFNLSTEGATREPWVRTIQDVATWVMQQVEASSPPFPINPTPSPQAIRRIDSSHGSEHKGDYNTLGNGNATNRSAQDSNTQLASEGHDASTGPYAGKIVLVTGSGRGIGKFIAMKYAAAGATVLINSFHSRNDGDDTVREIERKGGNAIALWGSIANPSQVESLFEQIDAKLGRLDHLICNASDGRIGPFLTLKPDDWDRAFRTNVSGHHQCAVLASQLMKEQGGSIVTLSAVGADRYIRGLGSQGVVKASVETMTRYLACELGPMGIRVNCVCGGPVYGELLDQFPDSIAAQQHWESMTPGGELSYPSDLANTIFFLTSRDALGVNGAIWTVDRGFSAIADGRARHTFARQHHSLSHG